MGREHDMVPRLLQVQAPKVDSLACSGPYAELIHDHPGFKSKFPPLLDEYFNHPGVYWNRHGLKTTAFKSPNPPNMGSPTLKPGALVALEQLPGVRPGLQPSRGFFRNWQS